MPRAKAKAAPPVNNPIADMVATDELLGAAAAAADQLPPAAIAADQVAPGAQIEPVDEVPIKFGTLTVPMLATGGYAQTHIDRRLRPADADALRQVQNALVRQAACLDDDRPVKNAADALCWILEQIRKQPCDA